MATNPLYDEISAIALDKIAEFGADVVINHGTFTYDRESGQRTGSVVSTVYKGLVITDYARLLSDFRITGNASTMKVDVGVMFGPDVSVADDDTIVVDGVTYNIFRVNKIAPGGVLVYQKVYGRR